MRATARTRRAVPILSGHTLHRHSSLKFASRVQLDSKIYAAWTLDCSVASTATGEAGNGCTLNVEVWLVR
jgi:hypothetical protein